MRIEVWGQVKQIGRVLEFCVQDRVMMAADIVGDVPVQYVGEDEGRWTIACICNQCLVRKSDSLGY